MEYIYILKKEDTTATMSYIVRTCGEKKGENPHACRSNEPALKIFQSRAEALKTDPSEFWTHKALLIEKLKNLDPQETEFTHQYNDTWLNICSLITDFLLLGCLKTVERAVSDSAQTDWARISLSEFKRFIESSFHEWSKNSLPQFIDSGN